MIQDGVVTSCAIFFIPNRNAYACTSFLASRLSCKKVKIKAKIDDLTSL